MVVPVPWLEGLRLPATKDDAIAHAEAQGAPPRVIEFIEALPAAVFGSAAGLHHAFVGFDLEHAPEHEPPGDLAEDGEAS